MRPTIKTFALTPLSIALCLAGCSSIGSPPSYYGNDPEPKGAPSYYGNTTPPPRPVVRFAQTEGNTLVYRMCGADCPEPTPKRPAPQPDVAPPAPATPPEPVDPMAKKLLDALAAQSKTAKSNIIVKRAPKSKEAAITPPIGPVAPIGPAVQPPLAAPATPRITTAISASKPTPAAPVTGKTAAAPAPAAGKPVAPPPPAIARPAMTATTVTLPSVTTTTLPPRKTAALDPPNEPMLVMEGHRVANAPVYSDSPQLIATNGDLATKTALRTPLTTENPRPTPAKSNLSAPDNQPDPPAAKPVRPTAKPAAPTEAPAHPSVPDNQPKTDMAAAITTLQQWAQDWAASDAERYFAHYAGNFRPYGQSLADWKRYRLNMVTRRGKLAVKVALVKTIRRGNTVRLEFVQDYRSRYYQSRIRKALIMIKVEGQWKIQREIVTQRGVV